MKFSGITEETLYLMSENRFNNSKAFYEENKKKINEGFVHQMRAIVEDLMDLFISINPDFILDPVRCVCRVRRDTRFTHDKSLYRANLWLMIRHQKNHLPTPSFWFEVSPMGIGWGVGILSTTPSFMEFFRKEIAKKPNEIEKATKELIENGFHFSTDKYKINKAVADGIKGKYLSEWYNSKEVFALHEEGTGLLTQPETLIKRLEKAYLSASDFYRLMLEITQKFNSRAE